jgi:leucyl-tRNA synthetase
MKDVGTGAIMGVPAHDERDFAFAKKYSLAIKLVCLEKITEVKDLKITDYKGSDLLVLLKDPENLKKAIEQAEIWLDKHGPIPWKE